MALLVGGFIAPSPPTRSPLSSLTGLTWGDSHDNAAALNNTAGKPMIRWAGSAKRASTPPTERLTT